MAGNLDLKELEDLIRKEEVDTVLTVFPDIQGRLLGKRVVGHYFLDHVAADGLHACLYLLTVDMEMEPLPGFRLTSWEKGYGDMKMRPDLGTLRLIPSCRPRGRSRSSAPSGTAWRGPTSPWSSPRENGAKGRRRSTCATPKP